MFRLYSKNCEYALRILSEIPVNKANEKFQAEDLSRKTKIALASARKVLQLLTELKFLSAVTGPNGGYQLVRDPHSTTVMEIIEAIDGKSTFDQCVMGLAHCSSRNPCPVHEHWSGIKTGMKGKMRQTKLAELMHA